MGLSRIRWIFAGAVAVLTLVAAIRALRTYIQFDLTVGVLSVLALVVTLLGGLASLYWARRRIGVELAVLKGGPGAAAPADGPAPVSTLLRERRERLQAIQAAGVRPERQVLADATAADEAGRAYIGRYFVATTVLIGLVGTFAGLMATLSKVAPLLHDKEAGGLTLLAGPLAGLHVTFGASLVAILATLALALAQGDLALHEEQAMAALEDRTTHHLIPELWPPSEEPAERTVRAVSDLKTMLADAVAESLEKSAGRMAETARGEAERAARALELTAVTVEKQISQLGTTVASALRRPPPASRSSSCSWARPWPACSRTAPARSRARSPSSTPPCAERWSRARSTVERQMTQLTDTLGVTLESSASSVERQMTHLTATVGGALETSASTVERQMIRLSETLEGALETSASSVERQMTQPDRDGRWRAGVELVDGGAADDPPQRDGGRHAADQRHGGRAADDDSDRGPGQLVANVGLDGGASDDGADRGAGELAAIFDFDGGTADDPPE